MYYLPKSEDGDLAGLGQWQMLAPVVSALVPGITGLFMGKDAKDKADKQQKMAAQLAKNQALAQARQQAEAQSLAAQQAQIEQVQAKNRTTSVALIAFGTFSLALGGIFLVMAIRGMKKE